MIDKIKKYNLPLLAIAAVLGISIAGVTGGLAQAASPIVAPGLDSQMSMRHTLGLPDDRCYSTLSYNSSRLNSIAPPGMNPQQFGLVNAIVRLPIYDWDQDGIRQATTAKQNASNAGTYPAGAPKPVGYAKAFRFKVAALPNFAWLRDYTQKQLPYDLAMVASLTGAPNRQTPPDPVIANPFLYARAALIDPYGNPTLPNHGGAPSAGVEDVYEDSENIDSGAITDDPENNGAEGVPGQIEDGNDAFDDHIKDVRDNGELDTLQDLKNNPALRNSGNYQSAIMSMTGVLRPVLNLFSNSYSVGYGDNQGYPNATPDECYESLRGSKKVPSYAFSVTRAGLPITIPGALYSIPSLLFKRELSFSGFTFYPESYNGKAILDCFARGATPTILPGPDKIKENVPFLGPGLIENAVKGGQAATIVAGVVGVVGGLFGNEKVFWASLAVAVDSLTGIPVMVNMPTPYVKREDYYSGYKFLFYIDDGGSSIQLPDDLKGRQIDLRAGKSSLIDLDDAINIDGVSGTNPRFHDKSSNGRTFFPNLYIKLKKPYRHNPQFVENNITPDGQSFSVTPQIKKDGFKAKPEDYDIGGHNNDAPANGYAKARIAEIIINPGYTGNEIRETDFVGDALGSTNGLDPNDLCDFLKSKVPSSDDAIKECDANRHGGEINLSGLPGIGGENNTNTVNLLAGNITREIDAETPPGTKFCYAIYLDKRDNDLKFDDADYYTSASNYNDEYSAEHDKRYLSRTHCVISGYKPSLQVRGGDLMVNGDVYTATNRKKHLRSTLGGASPQLRTYGSWSEYGLLATGSVSNAKMGSGAKYRVGQDPAITNPLDPHGYLTFSNHYDGGDPQFGNFKDPGDDLIDGFDKVEAFFFGRQGNAQDITGVSGSCKSGNTVNLKDCDSGDYHLTGGGTYTINGSDFNEEENKSKSLVFFVEDGTTITIENNIETPGEYSKPADISQVVFTPATEGDNYLVNIHQDVTQVDAWMINPRGAINTCYTGSYDADTPRSKVSGTTPHPCYENRLVINGPVAAQHLFLRRSGGVDQNQSAPYSPLHQSIPGELFNLRPDAYLWAQNQVSSGGQKFTTVQTIDLPPRY